MIVIDYALQSFVPINVILTADSVRSEILFPPNLSLVQRQVWSALSPTRAAASFVVVHSRSPLISAGCTVSEQCDLRPCNTSFGMQESNTG
jgi:hypothetical protein